MIPKTQSLVFSPHKRTLSLEVLRSDFLNLGKNIKLKVKNQNAKLRKRPKVLKLNIIVLEFWDISL